MHRIFGYSIGLILISMLILPAVIIAGTYRINMNTSDFNILSYGSYHRIECNNIMPITEAGSPELPMIDYKYYLPNDEHVIGIKIINTTKEKIPGEYNIYPAQDPFADYSNIEFTSPNEEIYLSNSPYPGMSAEFANAGYYRGHHIADIVVYPFEYIPSENVLYFYSSIEFEFVYSGSFDYPITKKCYDESTLRTINGWVDNKFEAPVVFDSPITAKVSSPIPTDSIPCVIITNYLMEPVFWDYALWKTIKGTRTEVMRLDLIESIYSDSAQDPTDVAEMVRLYIRSCYNNQDTRWIIIGGDVDIIPAKHVDSRTHKVLTDFYYSCLDGNWNDDTDSYFGECEWQGDTVDYFPEVCVGRIPCHNSSEAQIVIDKITSYESQSDTAAVDYRNKALFTSSNLHYVGDSYNYSESLIVILPDDSCFDIVHHDSQDSITVLNAMANNGLIVNYSHAQNAGNFITEYWITDEYFPTRQLIYSGFIDTMHSNGRYPVFFNYTCYNAKLDDTIYNDIASSFMLSPEGGGAAYIGSTDREWSPGYIYLHRWMFREIFDSSRTQLGKVLADAKTALWIPRYNHTDDIRRFGLFAYMYLGDPMMEIWTDEPKLMLSGLLPDTIGTGVQNIVVRITETAENGGNPIQGAKVCLHWGWDCIYEVDYTSGTGIAGFESVDFPSTGEATVVTTYPNHFVLVDTIHIVAGGPGGCPMMYVYDGTEYQFVNNILAQSEDFNLALNNNPDYYPVYKAPLLQDRSIKIKIKEDEKEVSHIDQLGLSYINYPINKRIVYTHNNEFRYLSGDSLLPISAVDNKGNDVTELISGFDDNSFVSSEAGYVIVKYRKLNGILKPTDDGGGGFDPPPGGKGPPKFTANDPGNSRNKIVIVSALDVNNSWQTINTLYPRIRHVSRFTDLSEAFVSKEISVKIEWNDNIAIDCLPYYFFEGTEIEQTGANMITITHSDDGDVSEEAFIADDDEIILSPGEYIDMQFGPIPYMPGYKIAAVLKALGRYETMSNEPGLKGGFAFEQNYPNPFNPTTKFSFSLPVAAPVCLTVYNVLGQRVITLADKTFPAGTHEIVWNGRDSKNNEIASGIYFARFKAVDFIATKKIMMVK